MNWLIILLLNAGIAVFAFAGLGSDSLDSLAKELNTTNSLVTDEAPSQSAAKTQADSSRAPQSYGTLNPGFNSSLNYTQLKDSISSKLNLLGTLDEGSEDYKACLAEINALWGDISVLAGEFNSGLSVIITEAESIDGMQIPPGSSFEAGGGNLPPAWGAATNAKPVHELAFYNDLQSLIARLNNRA